MIFPQPVSIKIELHLSDLHAFVMELRNHLVQAQQEMESILGAIPDVRH
jgi:hypothetical protein